MDYVKEYFDQNEKPLDKFVPDGGFCGIFRSIGCIGDSLSSGEFEGFDSEGKRRWIDCYEYSWGQFMGRTIGSKIYNFSRGGMTAKAYMEGFAAEKDFFNPELAANAYIVAMGCNDITSAVEQGTDLGSMNDVHDDYTTNADTFAGHYGAILAKYHEISPDARFFLVTLPKRPDTPEEKLPLQEQHRDLLYAMAEKFPNTYVLDIRQYAPVYDDRFREAFFQQGHLSAAGYCFTAKMFLSYIDYIIRHNMNDFRKVGMYEIGLH